MEATTQTMPSTRYVDFWNQVLVPKFVRWRHVLVGGLASNLAISRWNDC
jgi:hypothetical protein